MNYSFTSSIGNIIIPYRKERLINFYYTNLKCNYQELLIYSTYLSKIFKPNLFTFIMSFDKTFSENIVFNDSEIPC